MQPGLFENAVWYLNILAAAALALRIHSERLTANYRLLFWSLVSDACGGAVSVAFTLAQNYKWVSFAYIGSQGIKLILSALIAMEFFQLALEGRPALARFGRKMIGYFFAAGLTLAVLNMWFGDAYSGSHLTGVFVAFERSMDLMVMVVLLLIAAFLLWYPLKMRKNLWLCIGGYVLYSFTHWAGLLVVALWPSAIRLASTAILGLNLTILVFWAVALKRSGELVTTVSGHRWDAAAAEDLTAQLDDINTWLDALEKNKSLIRE